MPAPLYSMVLESKVVLSTNTVQLGFGFQGKTDGSSQESSQKYSQENSQNSGRFSYQAGQFIQLLLDIDGKIHKRSYSVANSPEDFQKTGRVEIALSFVKGGLASRFFADAPLGTALKMTGPFGVLTLPESLPGQLVLAGTGTGIAPYRAMIPDLLTLTKNGTPVSVIAGFRHRQDRIYQIDFSQLGSIQYRTCLSRETAFPNEKAAGNHEYPGYVQEQFSSLTLNPSCDQVYLCGNPGMIDDAAGVLKEMGLPTRQIKREKYVYSGH